MEKETVQNKDTPQKTAQMEDVCCCQCSHKTKERSEKEYRDLMNRLKRIEGQAAVNAALNSFNRVLLTNHLHTCVAENVRAGNDEVLDELAGVLQKLMK